MTFYDCRFTEQKLDGIKFHHFNIMQKIIKREKRSHGQSKVPGSTRWTFKKKLEENEKKTHTKM